jgi:hypothetical protein
MEQLDLVLTRAGSAPLDLNISWPVEIGTLELISSRKYPIRSLRIGYDRTTPFVISRFQDLNLSELQELYFRHLPWDPEREIMDLALQSDCKNMVLGTSYDEPSLELFKHKLLQQVGHIRLSGNYWIITTIIGIMLIFDAQYPNLITVCNIYQN